VGKIKFRLVWFDSLGAKSACTLVETPDVSVLIDPGAAVMQPSFPASLADKMFWLKEAREAIMRASKKCDVIVISHYHHDHYMDSEMEIYKGKLILAKNPNEYINDTQRMRAYEFYNNISKTFGKKSLDTLLRKKEPKSYSDPYEELVIAKKRDYGDYAERKRELLSKGRKWFFKRVENWNSWELIPELKFKNCEVRFVDGKTFRFGKTKIEFSKPFFHGIEYARVGWVISTVITYNGERFIHTSDLEGPTIEDQAEWVINKKPKFLILDGPSTYLIPFMLNLINLRRAIDNTCRIIRECKPELIIYDHHLPRDRKFKERVKKVYVTAKEEGVNVLTAAEYLGKTPVVLKA